MLAIERDNPSLKGVLPKDYAHPRLDKQRLGQLIDMIGNIGLGDKAQPLEGHPRPRLRVLPLPVRQRRGQEGRPVLHAAVRRAAAGRDARALQGPRLRPVLRLRRHVRAVGEVRGGPRRHGCGDISVFGQESNHTTWRLAKMNLAIRGIDGNLGPEHADSFHRDLHPDLKADYVLANPPFNDSDWRGELLRDDKRWQFGTPPAGNANYAWVQHFIYHLAPTGTGGLRAGQRLDVVQPVRRRRDPQGDHRGRPGGLHGRAARPAFLLHADPRLPVVHRAGQGGTQAGPASATGAARSSSSTPASSAR